MLRKQTHTVCGNKKLFNIYWLSQRDAAIASKARTNVWEGRFQRQACLKSHDVTVTHYLDEHCFRALLVNTCKICTFETIRVSSLYGPLILVVIQCWKYHLFWENQFVAHTFVNLYKWCVCSRACTLAHERVRVFIVTKLQCNYIRCK